MDVTWRMCVVVGLVATVTRSYEYDPNYLIPPHCKPCDAMACPILFYCAGTKVKDHCGCCERCSSDLFQPHAPPRTVPGAPNDGTGTETDDDTDACKQIACPKFQVCMINSQGLPLCTCPSVNICETGRKKDKQKEEMVVCGNDGKTYLSRCHMRIANCMSGRRIKRAHKGPCNQSDLQPEIVENRNDVIEPDANQKTDEESLKAIERANRRRLKRKRRKEKQRRKERERKEKKERKSRKNRRKRMKRRNDINARSYGYYYLLGKKTNWGTNQVRRNRAL